MRLVGYLPLFLVTAWLAPICRAAKDQPPLQATPRPSAGREAGESESLSMSPAVACREVKGFEDYEPLPDAALTAEEKLIVYYRPFHYQTERKAGHYRAHLTQDGRIHRRGEKAVLLRKDKMVDYEPESDRPLDALYMKNSFSLKGLRPGEYDFEIVLHDRLGMGPETTATQLLKFRVIAAGPPEPKSAAGRARDRLAPP